MKGPLGLPPGSARDIIALVMTVGFVAGFLVTERISGEQFVQIFMAVLGIYGIMRQQDKARGEPSDRRGGGDDGPGKG